MAKPVHQPVDSCRKCDIYWLLKLKEDIEDMHASLNRNRIGNESMLIQLAQCWFPGLAISNANI